MSLQGISVYFECCKCLAAAPGNIGGEYFAWTAMPWNQLTTVVSPEGGLGAWAVPDPTLNATPLTTVELSC